MVGRNEPSLAILQSGGGCDGNNSKPLLLSPYIRNGQIIEAQELSRVVELEGIESYSGFLTVNQTFDANMFFWFFPARAHSKLSPVRHFELDSLVLFLNTTFCRMMRG